MVSRADLTDQHHRSVSGRAHPPPPPSMSSSRQPHRRHRHGRSHHGGSAYQPKNEFPYFAHTGDVEISIKAADQERSYLLHRLILIQCSGFFDASTSEEWSRAQEQRDGQQQQSTAGRDGEGETGLAKIREDSSDEAGGASSIMSGPTHRPAAPKMRWRYELDWDNAEDDEEPILVQKPPTNTLFGGGQPSVLPPDPPPSSSKPQPQQGLLRSVANLTGMQSALHLPKTAAVTEPEVDPTIRDYDNLFRIFYNHAPILNSVNIACAYAECKSLLALADMYDALPVTGPRIDHHLLGFSSRLFKQIAKYPPSYLKLGYLARSKVIFSEALIHVVGQWPAAYLNLQNATSPVPDDVLDLIEDKVDELEDMKARIEAKLFRLTLTTSRGERVSPSNAYIDWLALSLFRQWLVENTTPPPAPILKKPPTTTPNGNNHSRQPSNNNANTTNPNATAANTASNRAPQSPHGTSTQPSSTAKPTPALPFAPGRIYRLIGSSSSEAYLPHAELKRFLKLHPTSSSSSDSFYSRDSMKRFERKMDEIKRLAREIVKPLMRNFLELDLRGSSSAATAAAAGDGDGHEAGSGLPYLTCTRVEDADFPWD
ncbi:hypothetical protein FQN54_000020 [Arachnomyces sp. PD_36]|nr:hypothetical protein FQN54_000020 [Arachnomyces sp. PD_36]